MFKKFELKLDEAFNVDESDLEKFKENSIKKLDNDFEKYISNDGVIDGSALENEWFPDLKYDIFISHSHNNEEEAIKLAMWLKENFGLNCFIDSFVWGSADKLLKKIDKIYCKNGDECFNYYKRNFSTSHVHMMLSIALSKVINKSEAVFFLNTPESISLKEFKMGETYSPWIYSEIYTANNIKINKPDRYLQVVNEKFEISEQYKDLNIKYSIELDEFIKLDYKTLEKWNEEYKKNSMHPLDVLYGVSSKI